MAGRRGNLSSLLRAGVAAGLLTLGLWGLNAACPALGQDSGKAPPAGKPGAPQKQLGWLFRVELPITGRTSEGLRDPVRKAIETAAGEQARPVLIFEFTYPKEESEFARHTLIGSAFDLASFLSSETVSRARTVAYLPQPVQGHAVLAVLACDEIAMAPDAELGPATIDSSPSDKPAIVASYRTIVTRRKKFLEDVAVKLADPSQELLQVETDKGGTQYVTREDLEKLKKGQTVMKSEVLFPANQPARFFGSEAKHKSLIEHLANNRVELVRKLELSEPIRDEIQVVGSYRAVQVDVKGPIKEGTAERAQRMIRKAIRDEEANFVCVWIDSAGGSPVESMELARYLATDPELKDVQTVAYVSNEARANAALIALACNEIAIHPRAALGGEGDYAFSPPETREMVTGLRELMRRKGRSWSVGAAMFDPALVVYRCTRGNQTAYFCDDELSREPDPGQWKKWETIPMPGTGKPLSVAGSDAATYLPGIRKVESRAEFRELYNLTKDPALLEPTWVDVLVEALASPAIGVFLLIVGGAALYAELHSPGIGVGAFVATICFALFFWSHFLGGTAGWLEVVLFVAGISCLLLEVFVIPGFGIFGLGGGALILLSLVLACQTFVIPRNAYQVLEFRNSLLAIAAALVGIIAAASTLNRWLPRTPFLGQMVLSPPSDEEAEAIRYSETLAHFEAMVGMRGKTTTPLMPGGKARFGKELVDVMTGGEFVDRDALVEVVDVRGAWVVVRAVEEKA
jgi:membrane-bound serine protease (ClpP class)